MQGNGLVQVPSPHSVDETVKRLQSVLAQKGLQVFALVGSGQPLPAYKEWRSQRGPGPWGKFQIGRAHV